MRFFGLCLSTLLLSACSDKAPPTWPADGELTIETTATTAELRWPAPTDDNGVTRVIVRLGDEDVAELDDGATRYTAEGLRGETAVRFSVIAVDEAGNRSEPLEGSARTADGTAPRWPTGSVLAHEDGVFRWSAAEDSTGVSVYVLSLGGEELTRTSDGTFAYEGDPAGATVVAYDAAENASRPLAWRDGQTLDDVVAEVDVTDAATAMTAAPLSDRLGPAAVQRIRRAAIENGQFISEGQIRTQIQRERHQQALQPQ